MKKLIRITTVASSLDGLLSGQLKFMKDHFEVIGIASASMRLDKVEKEQEVRVIPLEMSRTITPIKDLSSLFKLYRILKKEKPYIVHTHTPKAGIIGMLASYFARVPHRLHTVAGMPLLEAVGKKRTILNFVEKLTYKCATKVYPNSFGLKDIILENKFADQDKIKVIGNGSSNGIDVSHFDPGLFSTKDNEHLRSSLEIEKDDFVFVFIGRLVKDKGINELVAAFTEINKLHPHTKLLMAGMAEKTLDPLLPETEHQINNHKNIIHVGWQWDVRPYLATSNALAFPSYREGFPNVVMQAGSMGLPSIVTNINGCNEIIIEGKNGMIIPVKSQQSLFDAMVKILEMNSFNQKEIRDMIADRYGRQFIWNSILEEYKTLPVKD